MPSEVGSSPSFKQGAPVGAKDRHPGQIDLGSGVNPIDIWLGLHADEKAQLKKPLGLAQDLPSGHEKLMRGSARQLVQMLSAFPAIRWCMFAEAVGWTPVAASALSWCQGASLADVLHIWRLLDVMPAPEPGADYAACLINPALLPQNRFSALIDVGEDIAGVAVLIAARAEPPEMDLAPEQAQRLHPDLKTMLRCRMLCEV